MPQTGFRGQFMSPHVSQTSRRGSRGEHFLSHEQEGWRNRAEGLIEFIVLVGTVIYAMLGEQLYLLAHQVHKVGADVGKLGVFLGPFIKPPLKDQLIGLVPSGLSGLVNYI